MSTDNVKEAIEKKEIKKEYKELIDNKEIKKDKELNKDNEIKKEDKEFKLLNNIDDANEFIIRNYIKTLLRKNLIPAIYDTLKNTNISQEKIDLFMKKDEFKITLNKSNIDLIITFIHIILKDLENWVAYKNFKKIIIDDHKENYKEAITFMQQYGLVSSMINTLYSIYIFPKVYKFEDVINKFSSILTDDKEGIPEFYKIDFEIFGTLLVKLLNIMVYYIYTHIEIYNNRAAKTFKLVNVVGSLNMLFINNKKIRGIMECYEKLSSL